MINSKDFRVAMVVYTSLAFLGNDYGCGRSPTIMQVCSSIPDRWGHSHSVWNLVTVMAKPTRISLGMVCERQGQYIAALTHAQQALDFYRATGHTKRL